MAFLVCLASQTSENVKILPRKDQDRIRLQHECRRVPDAVHGLPVRKDAASIVGNFPICPRLIGGAAAGNADAIVEAVRWRDARPF
jgi:hypothetical protein